MNTGTLLLLAGMPLVATVATAQPILFDFENAPIHSSLPIDLTVGGITAHFSATGGGFSIQPANTMGFTPPGFSGLCIYPNSIFAADLHVGFSLPLVAFSILYSPQELGCDDSATMRVTAYSGASLVGTATVTAAAPGTWPSETLSFASATPFDSVVVHYDSRPPTCQDWGPIFMADNMNVTPMPAPIVLTNGTRIHGGSVQFDFAYTAGAATSAWASTDPTLPIASWTFIGAPSEIAPGQFRFTDLWAPLYPDRYYQATSP